MNYPFLFKTKIHNPNLGLIYQGSKRSIAYKLLQAIADLAPNANNFYDLFGSVGGIYDYIQKNIYPALKWNERRLIFVDITLKLEAIRIAQMWSKFKHDDFDTLKNITQKKAYKNAKRLDNLKELEQLQRLEIVALIYLVKMCILMLSLVKHYYIVIYLTLILIAIKIKKAKSLIMKLFIVGVLIKQRKVTMYLFL